MSRATQPEARGLLVFITRMFCLGDPNLRARLRVIHVLKALRRLNVDDIADAGCGKSGRLGWFGGIAFVAYPLSRLYRESQVTGYDIDSAIVECNNVAAHRARAINLHFEALDLQTNSWIRTYSVVVFSDVAKDLRRDAELIRAVSRLVRPGGRLVMICPSSWPLVYRHGFHRIAIESGFTSEELCVFVRSIGLEIESVRPIVGRIAGMMAITSSKIASVHFLLLVLTFPLLISIAILDLVSAGHSGDAFLVVAAKPDAA